MIENIHIKNFKSHADTSLDLTRINILTGLNGMGKSSIIQALLLLRQTQAKGLLNRGLDLNGELCSIGTAKDCIYQFAPSDDIIFSIKKDGEAFEWAFRSEVLNLDDTFIKLSDESITNNVDNVLFNSRFQYISAFRNGPVGNYIKDTSSVELLHQISRKEGRCELVAHFLHHFQNNVISDEALILEGKTTSTLLKEVEVWMRAITPNLNIHVEPKDTSFNINYSFSRGKGGVHTNKFKAPNIGFGISYALPIVVAILQACSVPKNRISEKKEHLIIIENPEAHIHPSGQSKLMELICLASKNGVQFLIETQSDHIINGLLVATKKEIVQPENSNIYFFSIDTGEHATTSTPLQVLKGGRIKNTPKGFFDQMDYDMKTLMGF